MIVPAAIIALISSVATEILKLFPSLRATKARQQITVFIITAVLSISWLATEASLEWEGVIGFLTLAFAVTFGIYGAIIKPIELLVVNTSRRIRAQKAPNSQ